MANFTQLPAAQVVFCVLLAIVVIGSLFVGVSHIIDELRLANSEHVTMATVVETSRESSSVSIFTENRGRPTSTTAINYARVEYRNAHGDRHRTKIVAPDTVEAGDQAQVIYVPDYPTLVRMAALQHTRSFTDVYLNSYFISAAIALLLFFFFGGGILLGWTDQVPFKPNQQ